MPLFALSEKIESDLTSCLKYSLLLNVLSFICANEKTGAMKSQTTKPERKIFFLLNGAFKLECHHNTKRRDHR